MSGDVLGGFGRGVNFFVGDFFEVLEFIVFRDLGNKGVRRLVLECFWRSFVLGVWG